MKKAIIWIVVIIILAAGCYGGYKYYEKENLPDTEKYDVIELKKVVKVDDKEVLFTNIESADQLTTLKGEQITPSKGKRFIIFTGKISNLKEYAKKENGIAVKLEIRDGNKIYDNEEFKAYENGGEIGNTDVQKAVEYKYVFEVDKEQRTANAAIIINNEIKIDPNI